MSVPVHIRTEHLPNVRLQRDRWVNPLGTRKLLGEFSSGAYRSIVNHTSHEAQTEPISRTVCMDQALIENLIVFSKSINPPPVYGIPKFITVSIRACQLMDNFKTDCYINHIELFVV